MIVNHVLRTERLLLDPVTALDLTALAAHWTQPDVRKFLFDGAILSAEEIITVIAESRRDFAAGGYGFWVIRELADDDGALAGTVGLRQLDELGPEIVYSLTPGVWGKGYATEAAGAVVDYALGALGLPEVLAEVDNGNAASAAVITRLGLVPFEVVPGLLGPMTRYRKTRPQRGT
ncbi:MAG TPA: GNAT family N-acetyltransferase [Streptosporangiaceae bacterium]|jgi:RimJ/RimL family protein N-acetyltransferase